MSLKLQKKAWEQPIKRPGAKLLLLAVSYLSSNGDVFANHETLAKMTSTTTRSVRENLSYLVNKKMLTKLDTYSYKINFKKEDDAEELEDTSETQEDTSETLEDASPPYIENGKLTEVNGIISQKTFLEGIEARGITREFAQSWYERQEEQGWFVNPHTQRPKPFAKNLSFMLRNCKRDFDGSERSFPQKNRKNGAPSIWELKQQLTVVQSQLTQSHPGNPAKEVPCGPNDPMREEWWGLKNTEKELKTLIANG